MSTINFRWTRDALTPQLLQAVGLITLEWAMIDPQVTGMLKPFWNMANGQAAIPQSFDKRVCHLRNFADLLYADEHEEWLTFRWYLQRLKEANGKRDAVAHGMPGLITKAGRAYPGLQVPHPIKKLRHIPMSPEDLMKLAKTMVSLNAETACVSVAISTAHAVSLPGTVTSLVDGKDVRMTKANRTPLLPRKIPVPPKFKG